MVMVMISTLMLIVFMSIFSHLYQDNIKDKQRILAEDFGYALYNEFVLASEAKPGYAREFTVPYDLEGFTYNAYITNRVLIINYTQGTIPFNIPQTQGQIVKGKNIIKNINDSICLNC